MYFKKYDKKLILLASKIEHFETFKAKEKVHTATIEGKKLSFFLNRTSFVICLLKIDLVILSGYILLAISGISLQYYSNTL